MGHNVKYENITITAKAIESNDGFFLRFKNAGNESLIVDGSVTPIDFTLEDLPETDFLLQRVTFLIGANDLLDLSEFGNIAALTNGISFEANPNTPESTAIAIIKTNGDTMLISSRVNTQSVKINGVTKSLIYGTWDFTETFGGNSPIIINKDLKIVVQDDLSLMEYFQVSCHGVMINNNGI
jgi:hypothetical protein